MEAVSPAIDLNGINLLFGDRVVLEDVNFLVERGDFVGLIGPNGAGKSVLLKVILGILKPQSGQVRLLGDTPERSRIKVGYVPQFAGFDRLFPITALDVVLMGLLGGRGVFARPRAEDYKRANAALTQVSLDYVANSQIGRLSGGEMQRVLIARALVKNPEMIILDEPTSSLDTKVGTSLYSLLTELAKTKTILLVSHDIGVIADHVKTIACLNRRLHCHHQSEITGQMLSEVYGCPVDLLAHGVPHRVLASHEKTLTSQTKHSTCCGGGNHHHES